VSKGKNTAGSGGRIRKSLEGRGPTPKAEDRVYHRAYRDKQKAQAKTGRAYPGKASSASAPPADWVVGRNPVLEALQAGLPVRSLYAVDGAERDARLSEIFAFAAANSLPMLAVTRFELDKLTSGAVHQGVALRLPNYEYADADELIERAIVKQGLLVALDGITDPHNLGAIIRSAAAFGADGVIIPSRRSASMTAATWKASAGAAARLPVAKTVNLNQFVERAGKAGFLTVGLAGEAEVEVADVADLIQPTVLVIGSEGDGLSHLMRQRCSILARIPIAAAVESLNASVAAAVALYQISQIRQQA